MWRNSFNVLVATENVALEFVLGEGGVAPETPATVPQDSTLRQAAAESDVGKYQLYKNNKFSFQVIEY